MSRETLQNKVTKSIHVQSSAGNGTQIGEDIPEDKIRLILGMVLSQGNGAAEELTLYHGDTVTPTSETVLVAYVPDKQATTIGSFDPDKPVLVLRPSKSGGSVTKDQLRASSTNAVDVTAVYLDQ